MINLILFILGGVFALHPDYWGVGVVLLLSLCIRAASGRKPNSKDNKKKTEQGDPQAQFELGRMYERGYGVPQDYKEAIKLYTQSAKQGNAEAHCSLGFMYYHGLGVLQDYTMAHMYWNIAAVSGVENAIKNRSVVEKKMTPSHIEQAKSLALEWLEREGEQSLGSEYQSIKSQKITEDTAYEMVACELELGEQQKGLWTKAFADAEGDENKQRALYIKMRVAELTGKPKVNRVTSSPTIGLSSEPPARPLGERVRGEQDLLGYIMQAIGYEYNFSATNVEEGYISKRGIESYVY